MFGVDNTRNDLKMSFMSKTTIVDKNKSLGTDMEDFEIRLDEDRFDLTKV